MSFRFIDFIEIHVTVDKSVTVIRQPRSKAHCIPAYNTDYYADKNAVTCYDTVSAKRRERIRNVTVSFRTSRSKFAGNCRTRLSGKLRAVHKGCFWALSMTVITLTSRQCSSWKPSKDSFVRHGSISRKTLSAAASRRCYSRGKGKNNEIILRKKICPGCSCAETRTFSFSKRDQLIFFNNQYRLSYLSNLLKWGNEWTTYSQQKGRRARYPISLKQSTLSSFLAENPIWLQLNFPIFRYSCR